MKCGHYQDGRGEDCAYSAVGRALMERDHQWVLDKRLTEVELNVWEFNEEAAALYVRMG